MSTFTVEHGLAICRDILGDSHLAATDNFFDLGGDSLAAVEVTTRVAQTYRVEIPLEDIFAADTLGDLFEPHVHP